MSGLDYPACRSPGGRSFGGTHLTRLHGEQGSRGVEIFNTILFVDK